MVTTYCGFVAIIGRPNVGKSTLFNQLLGNKVSIISSKPQTTRDSIIGINTNGFYQVIYIDTPGINIKKQFYVNRLMNRITNSSSYDVDIIIFVVEEINWNNDDELILKDLGKRHCPILLVINKVDKIIDKKKLLPYINLLNKKINFLDILPICAKNGMNVDKLAEIVRNKLPAAVHCFYNNYITDRSYNFILSEIIREKLMFFLYKELPYSVKVEIENIKFNNNSRAYEINGIIFTNFFRHKKIIIGNNGNMIKKISIAAREDIEKILVTNVYLYLFVKLI